MRITNILKTGYLVVALAALPVLAAAAGRTTPKPVETQQLIEDIRDDAHDVLDRADRLFAMSQGNNSDFQSHAFQLNSLRESVNDLSARLHTLQTTSADPAAQKEVDRALVLLRLVAGNATGAIQFVSEHPRALWQPEYRRYTTNLEASADQLAHLFDNYATYLRVHEKDLRLEKTLE